MLIRAFSLAPHVSSYKHTPIVQHQTVCRAGLVYHHLQRCWAGRHPDQPTDRQTESLTVRETESQNSMTAIESALVFCWGMPGGMAMARLVKRLIF